MQFRDKFDSRGRVCGEGTIQIFVKMDSRTYTCWVDSQTTASDLAKVVDLCEDDSQFIFSAKRLEKHRPLVDYGVIQVSLDLSLSSLSRFG